MNEQNNTIDEVTQRLLRLNELYREGVIDKQDYENTKRNLLLGAQTQEALGLNLNPNTNQPPQDPDAWTQHQVLFMGNASEYFKIWITNVGLTIVTLGIYYAWAKVRTRQYFYANTSLDGHNFFYHGKPLPILKANILLAICSGIYGYSNVSQNYWLLGAAALAFYIAYPWMVLQSLRFNLANTSYKNVRFKFEGTSSKAYRYYLWSYFVIMLSGGLGMPYVEFKKRNWLLSNIRYGHLKTEFFGDVAKFYINYIIAGVMVVVPYVLLIGGFAVLGAMGGEDALDNIPFWIYPLSLLLGLGAIASNAYASTANLVHSLEKTTMGSLRFTANYNVWHVVGMSIVNALAVVCSLGLAIPWAKVRLNSYMLNNLVVWSKGPLPEVEATSDGAQSTVGDAFTDAFGVDIAF